MGAFPSQDIPGNVVSKIGLTTKRIGDKEFSDRVILHFGPCNTFQTGTVIIFKSEKELLLGFRDYIIKRTRIYRITETILCTI